MKRDRIGLFGGSFNPPHLGHIQIAQAALRQLNLDEVRWIPNSVSPLKQADDYPDAAHRLKMIQLSIAAYPSFSISDIELKRGGISYTIDTIRELQKAEPGKDWYLILGEDAVRSFSDWVDPESIQDLVTVVVYPRGTHESPLPEKMIVLDGDFLEHSSTEIRSRIRSGQDLSEFLPDIVTEYIVEHGLYSNRA